MSRLPIIGGDYDSWGTVLNDYLTTAAAASSLQASTSVGATTISLATVPPGLKTSSIVAITVATTTCELRSVTNVTGNTVTLDAALRLTHAAGDQVVVVLNGVASARQFGAKGDSSTDDWAALQRAFIECDRLGIWLSGERAQYQITQPLFLNGSHLRNIIIRCQASGFAPLDTLGAAVTNCQNTPMQFTATASDNVFTTTVASGAQVNNLIAFNNPNGETFPGGVVSGRWYYVKTTPSSTTFTVSATMGGAVLDVTSDGAGYTYPDVNVLGRIFFEDVYLKGGGSGNANLNILRVDLQQPAYTKDLRIDGAVGGGGVLLWLSGQISSHYNTELVPSVNSTGIQIGATVDGVNHFSSGHGFFGLNITSSGVAGTTGIWVVNGHAIVFENLWTEGDMVAHLKLGDSTNSAASGIQVSGWSVNGGGTTAIDIGNFGSSCHITGYSPYSSPTNIITDNVRSVTLANAGIGDGRYLEEIVFPGGTKGYPRFPSLEPMGSVENPSDTSFAADTKNATMYLAPKSGWLTGIRAYLGASGSDAHVKGVVYSYASDLPSALLATGDELTVTAASARAWRTLVFSTPLLVRGGVRYWIGFINDQTTLLSYFQESPTTTGQCVLNSDTYAGGAANPFGAGTAQNILPALYAIIEP